MLLRKIDVVFTTLIYVNVSAINIVICLMLNKIYCIVLYIVYGVVEL